MAYPFKRLPNPFRRTHTVPPPVVETDQPFTSEQWAPGDLAECLHHGIWHQADGSVLPDTPINGTRYVVTGVELDDLYPSLVMLTLGAFGRNLWDSRGFRKVRPTADELICAEPEFIQLLQRRTTPAHAGLPV